MAGMSAPSNDPDIAARHALRRHQGIATGLLRGLGETRVPMMIALAGYWAVALPLGYVACFNWGWGVQGMWIGLASGLVLVGAALLRVWHVRVRRRPVAESTA